MAKLTQTYRISQEAYDSIIQMSNFCKWPRVSYFIEAIGLGKMTLQQGPYPPVLTHRHPGIVGKYPVLGVYISEEAIAGLKKLSIDFVCGGKTPFLIENIGRGNIELYNSDYDGPTVEDKSMNKHLTSLFLSALVWDRIILLAFDRGYTTPDSNRGIGKYLAEVAKCTFTDTRPDYMKAEDATFRKLGRRISWRFADERIQRSIRLSTETIERLSAISKEMDCIDKRSSDTARAGCVIEAIGLGDLTFTHADVPWAKPRPKVRKDVDLTAHTLAPK